MSGHEERTHRRYSPSKQERLHACPGSDRLLTRVPARPPSTYSIEGTKAHLILQVALENRCARASEAHRDFSILCMEELDETSGGPYRDFYFSINMALDYVYGILATHPDAIMFVETFVDPPSNVAPGEVGGYCDIAIYIPSLKLLYVIDYKHGAGVAKDAKNNPQPLQYAAGFVFGEASPIKGYDVDNIIVSIVQPRAFHEDGDTREHEVTPYEVYEYLETMDAAILASQAEDAPLVPEDLSDPKGSRQCQFCDAAPTCPAREAKALAVVNVQFAAVRDVRAPGIPDPATMELERLEYAALHMPMLKKWMDSVEQRLFELAQQGYPLRHHKIVEAQARRRWYGDPDVIAPQLAALVGKPIDDVMVKKLIGITAAEKLVVAAYKERAAHGKKKDAAQDGKLAMAFLTLKDTSGNYTLVTNDDPRPPVDRATVAFNQVGALLLPTNLGDDE